MLDPSRGAGQDDLGGGRRRQANPMRGGGDGVVLSEFRLDQSGSDNDEYVELPATPAPRWTGCSSSPVTAAVAAAWSSASST